MAQAAESLHRRARRVTIAARRPRGERANLMRGSASTEETSPASPKKDPRGLAGDDLVHTRDRADFETHMPGERPRAPRRAREEIAATRTCPPRRHTGMTATDGRHRRRTSRTAMRSTGVVAPVAQHGADDQARVVAEIGDDRGGALDR